MAARPALALAGIVALLAWIFLLDLIFPLGVAAGVPYITAVLLALWLESDRVRVGVAVAAGLLTILGFFLPEPHGVGFWIGLENRLIALFAISVTAVLGQRLLIQTREVRERERRLRAVLLAAPDAILTVDADARIESCNPAAGAMFGRRCELLIGTPLSALLPDVDADQPPASRLRTLDAQRSDGSRFPAEVSISRFPRADDEAAFGGRTAGDEPGTPEQVAVVRDVTVLRDAQQRTLRTQRLAAVGETLAVLSHEVRNELLAFRIGLKILADELDPQASKLIADLQASELRLSRLFEDVRHHAGPIRLNPGPCRLTEVWRRAWNACDRNGRETELIECFTGAGTNPGDDGATCVADAFRLEQVFRNLFENALAACSDPVRIEVRVSREEGLNGEALRISVRDNGPGLTPEARRKAFEPFFTTKSDGTGLGLAICSRILDAHGGSLTLREPASSKGAGRGAQFDLILPLSGNASTAALREMIEV
ncbi:two-component system sensor histidine kinase NtrB [Alienimonas californiensis]|uniref:histidine kinase n=1 Tax=Alienimonas californiensis TaxID=2527989 RepID=A0A517PFE8_9PLAN|nr:ATP-binding protein [Alienimonas californiensis]QDT18100.1 Sensor protein FixL [Alienimonas californiensis]